MTEARGETYWTSKNPGTCLCVYFPGFLDTKKKNKKKKKKKKEEEKEEQRKRYISTCIVRYYAELKKSTTRKSTSWNDNNRYAKGKARQGKRMIAKQSTSELRRFYFVLFQTLILLFCIFIVGPVYRSGFLGYEISHSKYPKFVQILFFWFPSINQTSSPQKKFN